MVVSANLAPKPAVFIKSQSQPMLRKLILFSTITLTLYSCGSSDNNTQLPPNADPVLFKEGKTLTQNLCLSCHGNSSSPNGRLAPVMQEVVHFYKQKYDSPEAFTEAIAAFVPKPKAENAILQHAVKKYGPMAPMPMDSMRLAAIAHYLYFNDLSTPDWLPQHLKEIESQSQSSQIEKPKTPLEIGLNLVLKTKAVIGKNLSQAIAVGGPVYAINFCNTKALPLTDSMAKELKVEIKRVSDQPRNPKNTATKEELAIIKEMKNALSSGKSPSPILKEDGSNYLGYYAIETNGMCLQCHGTPNKELQPETFEAIKAKYPKDQATGYQENQLRGIWVLKFPKTIAQATI